MMNESKARHLQCGEQAEQIAHAYLIDQGLKPVCRNFRCKSGEIDLVMTDKQTLVFIEVRYRKNDKYGSALESITPRKQARIIAAAKHYLVTQKADQPARFDVIAITGSDKPHWIANAFQVQD